MGDNSDSALPDCNSPSLILCAPTKEECVVIWNNTSAAWIDSLTMPVYLKESLFLTTVPLAKDGGMTTWVLVDKGLPPNQRPILCSCESFRKRSVITNAKGTIREGVMHGIASVFCPVQYRRRGYARRMMTDLIKILNSWQAAENMPCLGSTLYSDIGKDYYAKLGWKPNRNNTHVELQPSDGSWPASAKPILQKDLPSLCRQDEICIRKQMVVATDHVETRFTILPDLDQMGWHIGKEEFATDYLFGKCPPRKGARTGHSGAQVWATWKHRYYGRHDSLEPSNVLYILRMVLEGDPTATRLTTDSTKRPDDKTLAELSRNFKTVLQAAQVEAAEWKLNVVKLWDPTPLAVELLGASGLEFTTVERQEDSIASLLWYNDVGSVSEHSPLWVNNEHYAWQ